MHAVFRRKLLDREPLVGGWLQICHATVAELMGRAGYDWIGIDAEHTEASNESIVQQMRALDRFDMPVLVRMASNEHIAIRQVLDLGASGVIVPMVSSAAEAEAAVAAAKYPPRGERGFAFVRANAFGVEFDEYVSHANEGTTVIAMIETRAGVEHVEEIVQTDGIDGLLIGPYDLSGSYGVPGQVDHQLVTDASQRVLDAAGAAGKSAGIHIVTYTAANIASRFEAGFNLMALGMDTSMLIQASRDAVATWRSATHTD